MGAGRPDRRLLKNAGKRRWSLESEYSSGGGKKLLHSRCILKLEPTGFAVALDGSLKGSKELNITPRISPCLTGRMELQSSQRVKRTDECAWVELVRSCLSGDASREVKRGAGHMIQQGYMRE